MYKNIKSDKSLTCYGRNGMFKVNNIHIEAQENNALVGFTSQKKKVDRCPGSVSGEAGKMLDAFTDIVKYLSQVSGIETYIYITHQSEGAKKDYYNVYSDEILALDMLKLYQIHFEKEVKESGDMFVKLKKPDHYMYIYKLKVNY